MSENGRLLDPRGKPLASRPNQPVTRREMAEAFARYTAIQRDRKWYRRLLRYCAGHEVEAGKHAAKFQRGDRVTVQGAKAGEYWVWRVEDECVVLANLAQRIVLALARFLRRLWK